MFKLKLPVTLVNFFNPFEKSNRKIYNPFNG